MKTLAVLLCCSCFVIADESTDEDLFYPSKVERAFKDFQVESPQSDRKGQFYFVDGDKNIACGKKAAVVLRAKDAHAIVFAQDNHLVVQHEDGGLTLNTRNGKTFKKERQVLPGFRARGEELGGITIGLEDNLYFSRRNREDNSFSELCKCTIQGELSIIARCKGKLGDVEINSTEDHIFAIDESSGDVLSFDLKAKTMLTKKVVEYQVPWENGEKPSQMTIDSWDRLYITSPEGIKVISEAKCVATFPDTELASNVVIFDRPGNAILFSRNDDVFAFCVLNWYGLRVNKQAKRATIGSLSARIENLSRRANKVVVVYSLTYPTLGGIPAKWQLDCQVYYWNKEGEKIEFDEFKTTQSPEIEEQGDVTIRKMTYQLNPPDDAAYVSIGLVRIYENRLVTEKHPIPKSNESP